MPEFLRKLIAFIAIHENDSISTGTGIPFCNSIRKNEKRGTAYLFIGVYLANLSIHE